MDSYRFAKFCERILEVAANFLEAATNGEEVTGLRMKDIKHGVIRHAHLHILQNDTDEPSLLKRGIFVDNVAEYLRSFLFITEINKVRYTR